MRERWRKRLISPMKRAFPSSHMTALLRIPTWIYTSPLTMWKWERSKHNMPSIICPKAVNSVLSASSEQRLTTTHSSLSRDKTMFWSPICRAARLKSFMRIGRKIGNLKMPRRSPTRPLPKTVRTSMRSLPPTTEPPEARFKLYRKKAWPERFWLQGRTPNWSRASASPAGPRPWRFINPSKSSQPKQQAWPLN